jgi:hypothetical protein
MDLRPILKVERALNARLLRVWQPIAREAFAKVREALQARDWKAAYDAANALDLAHVASKNREFIKYYLLGAGIFGGRVAQFGKDPQIAEGNYEGLLAKVANQFSASVTQSVTAQARQKLLDLINSEQYGKVQKADVPKRFVEPFVSFQETGSKALQLLSALHSSRLAVWGFTGEAGSLGVDRYRLTAVLDGRTSPFCDMIDGTEFEVDRARGRITDILSVENPEDLKTLAPWPDQSRAGIAALEGLSNEELAARGYDVPPFHPWCRTLCALVDETYDGEVGSLPADEARSKEAQTPEAFAAIGADLLAPKELEQWNQQIGLPPAQVLAFMAGISATDLIDGELGKQKFFSFGPDGELKMSVEGSLASDDSLEEMKQVYDPFSGRLQGSWMEFNADDAVAAGWIGGSYQRMVELAQKLGGREFVIDTFGQYSCYAHALMGFVPATISDWEALQTAVEADLALGGTEEDQILKSLLNNSDPHAIWALAQFPNGQQMLSGKRLTMKLVFSDDDAMSMFRAALA